MHNREVPPELLSSAEARSTLVVFLEMIEARIDLDVDKPSRPRSAVPRTDLSLSGFQLSAKRRQGPPALLLDVH